MGGSKRSELAKVRDSKDGSKEIYYPGVRDSGDGSIEIDFQWNGRRYRERMALDPAKSENMQRAARKRATVLEDIANSTFVYAKSFPYSKHATDAPHSECMSLGQAFDQLFAQSQIQVAVSPETLDAYKRDAAMWKAELDADTDVKEITLDGVQKVLYAERIHERRRKRLIGIKRMRNALIPLRQALDLAKSAKKLEQNPLDDFKIKLSVDQKEARANPKIIEPYSVHEVRKLATAAVTGAVWKLWANSGLRGQELIALLWSDILPEGIRVTKSVRRSHGVTRVKPPKTEAGRRIVELSPQAKEALAELKKTTGARTHVCINPNTDEPFSGDRALRERFKSDCLKLGVRYRDVRLLRHSYASWALEAGESVLWVKDQLGHKTVEEVLRTYARHIPDNIEKHGQKLQRALRENRDLGHGVDKKHRHVA